MGVEAVIFETKPQESYGDPLARRKRQSTYKDIFAAIQNADLEGVKYFVENQKVDVNSRATGNSNTVVGTAAAAGNQKIVEYLISKGANVNTKDRNGYNSLLWALDKNVADLELIKYLVSQGAEVNVASSRNGYTPLHWAAFHNKLDVVKFLLENKANINAETNDGNTPYTLARANEHTEVATYLTNDPRIRVNGDIFAAAESGNIGLVLHMVENEHVQPFAKNKDGQTALHMAAANGKLPVVEYLLKSNKYVNMKNDRGETALILAAANAQLNVVCYLLENMYANPESVDLAGNTPLLAAAKNGHVPVLRYLVETANVDTSAKNGESYNALMVATQNNRTDAIKYLVDERRLNIYARSKKGETALHVAARMGFLDTVKYFVDEKGMEITIAAYDGRNVLHKACESNNVKTLRYLIEEKGADPTARDSNQNTILHIAVEHDRLELVRYLVDQRGMNVMATNGAGLNALSLSKTLPRNAVYQYFTKEKGITERPPTEAPRPTTTTLTTTTTTPPPPPPTTTTPRPTTTTTRPTTTLPPYRPPETPSPARIYLFDGQPVDLATRNQLIGDFVPTIGTLNTRQESFTENGYTTYKYFVNGKQFDLATRNKIIEDYKNAGSHDRNTKYYVNGQEVDAKTRNDFLTNLTVGAGGEDDGGQRQSALKRDVDDGVTYRVNGQIVDKETYMNAVKKNRQVSSLLPNLANRFGEGTTYTLNGRVVDRATYENAMNSFQSAPFWGGRRKRSGDVDRFETVRNDSVGATGTTPPQLWWLRGRNSSAGLLPSAEGQGDQSTRAGVRSGAGDATSTMHGLLTLMDVGARRYTNNRYKQHYKHESLLSPRELIENRIDDEALKAIGDFERAVLDD